MNIYILSKLLNKSDDSINFMERKRIYYIILVNISLVILFILGTISHFIFQMSPIHYIGDLVGILGVLISLYYIRENKLKLSSNILINTLTVLLFVYGIIVDYFAPKHVEYLRIYVSLFIIMGIFIIMTTIFISTTNFPVYTLVFCIILSLHFITIIFHNGGPAVINGEVISYFIIAILAVIITGFITNIMSKFYIELLGQIHQDTIKLQNYNKNLNDIIKRQTKDLRESNDRLQKYAQIASHDLKEPLRSISGFIGLIHKKINKKYPEDKYLDEYFDIINNSTNRMNGLINDILSFAKISNSKEEFNTIDLNNTITNIITQLDAAIKSKNAKINYKKLEYIQGQENLIFQIFLNLISNSIRYSKENINPVVNIESKIVNNKVLITIQDNGIGIPKHMQEKVFMPYVQNMQSATEGIGLGLSVCKSIIEFHSGEIWVESVEGEGSVFHILLPKIINNQNTGNISISQNKKIAS